MKMKELTLEQMENLQGGIDDRIYWAILCTGIGGLYSFVNLYVGLAVGYLCAVYGPSLDVPPISDLRDPGDTRSPILPSGGGTNLK
jgi:hypothetical protein